MNAPVLYPGRFWFNRFNVQEEIGNIEEENIGIAGVTPRLSDDESAHFHSQKAVKINRHGYIINLK